MGRDYRYARGSGLATRFGRPGLALPRRLSREGKQMKKIAATALVLALGLAACNKNNADTNAANETAVENTAATDVNVATDNATAVADNALNSDVNAADNSTANDVANATENK